MTSWARALAALLAAALGACAPEGDTVARAEGPPPGSSTSGGSSSSGGASSGGATSSSSGGPSYCGGSGPPLLADGTCTGTLSQRAFGRAACSCSALAPGADLVTDGFDSRAAPYAPGGGGADLGTEGGLSAIGLLQVGGNLAVSGGALRAGGALRVAGDLDVDGSLGQAGTAATVGGSARIGGDVSVASLAIAGSLTTPPGASLTGAITAASAASGAVTVPPACPCDPAQAIDVAAIVAQQQASNENASIGLSPDALAGASSSATLTLPCGRFYLSRVQGGDVTLRATGRAALFVASGLTPAGSFTVTLAPGAELDLFVAGPFQLPAIVRAGDPARPAALRIWTDAGGFVAVPYGAQWAANLYAPQAQVASNTPLDWYGAVLASSLVNAAPLSLHYDRAISAAAASCGR